MLVGKLSNGDRLMFPVTDAGELSRVFVAATDPIAKRIVIRIAGAGERVTVHTRDKGRWASVRMPALSVVNTSRPAPRTTVSVVEYVTRRRRVPIAHRAGRGSRDTADIGDLAHATAGHRDHRRSVRYKAGRRTSMGLRWLSSRSAPRR